MGLIIFGIGFGIIMGAGIFFLFILPLRKERRADEARQQALAKTPPQNSETEEDDKP